MSAMLLCVSDNIISYITDGEHSKLETVKKELEVIESDSKFHVVDMENDDKIEQYKWDSELLNNDYEYIKSI